MNQLSRKTKILLLLCFLTGIILGGMYPPPGGWGAYVEKQLSKIPITLGLKSPESEIEVYGIDPATGLTKLSSTAYLVADLEKGTTFKEKDSDKQFPIASVTKLMTAVVAVENMEKDAVATVSSSALLAYGREGALVEGEKIQVGAMLYPLLLESSNDAAEVLAETLGRPAFIDLMNAKAKSLGMTRTFYKDPSGLSPKNISTAKDLYKLAQYIREYRPEILKITLTPSYKITKTADHRAHAWYNGNKFLRINDKNYRGGKNGYTPEARQTGIAFFDLPVKDTAKKAVERRPVVAIVLNSYTRHKDLSSLETFVTNGVRFSREPSRQASLVFVGDIMLDRGVRASVVKNHKGDYGALFKHAFFLNTATLAFANLEGPLSDKGYDLGSIYSFRMSPDALTALTDSGIDALSVANNHSGDWGRAAFEDTLHRLDSVGIAPVGGGYDKTDATTVKIKDANGLKIGFIGFSDVGPKWLAQNDNLPVILMADNPDLEKIIREAASKVDHLVVSFHFGDEYEEKSNARQRALARKAIDVGAHIVVGHHSHTIQEVERYKGGVIAYSLGNFIFDQTFSEKTKEGLVLEVLIDDKKITEVNQGVVRLSDHFEPALAEEYDL